MASTVSDQARAWSTSTPTQFSLLPFRRGGQYQLFAPINYMFVYAVTSGTAHLSWVSTDGNGETLVVGRGFDMDVSSIYTFIPDSIGFIPEPGSLALVGMSLSGLSRRRQNG